MTDDVRLSVGLRRHRKTKRLKRILGADGCWSLVCLFMWVGEERWTGDLSGLSDHDLEEEADWEGEPGRFITALVEVGFMDGDPLARSIHDWEEHNPYAAGKGARIERGKRGAASRWNKHASSMQQASTSNALEQCPPAPAPAPTQPKAKAEKTVSPAGSRLPADWVIPVEWLQWAAQESPGVNARREADSFRDYWHSVAGSKGRKADWQATWRNWIRRANQDRRGNVNVQQQPRSAIERVQQHNQRNQQRREVASGTAFRIGHGDFVGEDDGYLPASLDFSGG